MPKADETLAKWLPGAIIARNALVTLSGWQGAAEGNVSFYIDQAMYAGRRIRSSLGQVPPLMFLRRPDTPRLLCQRGSVRDQREWNAHGEVRPDRTFRIGPWHRARGLLHPG
jgi:hypothetical protein